MATLIPIKLPLNFWSVNWFFFLKLYPQLSLFLVCMVLKLQKKFQLFKIPLAELESAKQNITCVFAKFVIITLPLKQINRIWIKTGVIVDIGNMQV